MPLSRNHVIRVNYCSLLHKKRDYSIRELLLYFVYSFWKIPEHSGCDELVHGVVQYVGHSMPERTQEISLSSNHTIFSPDLPGVYRVSIVVTNNEGLTSYSQAQTITIEGE